MVCKLRVFTLQPMAHTSHKLPYASHMHLQSILEPHVLYGTKVPVVSVRYCLLAFRTCLIGWYTGPVWLHMNSIQYVSGYCM